MDNRVLFGIMTLIFNSVGVPCFMAGKTKTGVVVTDILQAGKSCVFQYAYSSKLSCSFVPI